MAYLMVQFGAQFFGYRNPINDLLFRNGAVPASQRITPTPGPSVPITAPGNFYASTEGQAIQATQTAITELSQPSNPNSLPLQVMPTYTPYPTPTPYPTLVFHSALVGQIYAVGYSYYFPPFGPPNCSKENWKDFYCEDTTASGLPWSDYIGKGVAVPIQWKDKIPLLSVIKVLDNVVMEGEYLVLDYCGDCIKPEGHIYLDFLDNRARLNWTVPLLVEVVSVPK